MTLLLLLSRLGLSTKFIKKNMRKINLSALLLFFFIESTSCFAASDKMTLAIKEFLFTDPLKITFDNADKYLPAPISKQDGEKTIFLRSKPVSLEDSLVMYFVSLSEEKEFSYQMIFDIKSCSLLPSLIKQAVKTDFIYHLDGKVGNEAPHILRGSVDIKNWRVAFECINDGDATSENHVTRPQVVMLSGDRRSVKKITKRQKIECNFLDGRSSYDVVFQLDESDRILRNKDGIPYNTTRFDDDFISVSTTESNGFEIDRRTGKIQHTIDGSTFIGSCRKRSSEKKF